MFFINYFGDNVQDPNIQIAQLTQFRQKRRLQLSLIEEEKEHKKNQVCNYSQR